ncbi:hypothetical protein C5O78_03900 [Treponema phagedenis]|nr:hypothetical protein C5O78_03900 [Treponema phagedenis]
MPSLNPRIRRRKNSTDVLPTLYCKQAKLAGFILPRTTKSERARTPVVPNRSDVLKLPQRTRSFQTHRYNFATDGKIIPLCQTPFITGGFKTRRFGLFL